MFKILLLKYVFLVQVVTIIQCAITNITTMDHRLFQFKRRVRPLLKTGFMKSDKYLMETLKVNQFNETAAEFMIKNNLIWREKNNLDNIFSREFNEMSKQFPFVIESPKSIRQPKIGRIEITESNLMEQFRSANGRNKFIQYLAMIMEGMTKEVLEYQGHAGYKVKQWKIVGNSQTYLKQKEGCRSCIFAWLNLIYIAEKYYTGMMNQLVIFEAPSYVAKLANSLKCFVPSASNLNITLFEGNQKYQARQKDRNRFGC